MTHHVLIGMANLPLEFLGALLRDPGLARGVYFVRVRPELWPLLWMPAFIVLFGLVSYARPLSRLMAYQRAPLALLSAVTVCMFVWVSWRYVASPAYLDHAEPAIAGLSWYFWLGNPIYHAPDAPELYNNSYGPYVFILNGLLLGLAGPSIAVSKLGGVLAANAAIAIAFVVFYRQVGRMGSVVCVGILAALLLTFRHFSFWSRPESFLLLFVMVGLAACRARSLAGAVCLGLALGASVDLKPHAIGYFVPIAVMALGVFSPRQWAAAAASAVLAWVAPYLLSNVSLSAYARFLMMESKGRWFSLEEYQRVMAWSIAAAMPVCALWGLALFRNALLAREALEAQRRLIVATGIGFLVVLWPAARFGSGPHHLIPYFPVLLFVGVQVLRSGPPIGWQRSLSGILLYSVVCSWLTCAFGVGLWNAKDLRWETSREAPANQRGEGILRNLRRIQATYGSQYILVMGSGGTGGYQTTWYRPELVFNASPIGIDPWSLMDFKLGGTKPPPLERFQQWLHDRDGGAKRILWLIPDGDPPFSMVTWYKRPDNPWADELLFDDGFRADFARRFSALPDDKQIPYFWLYAETSGGGRMP